jgi:HEAT repeat protein
MMPATAVVFRRTVLESLVNLTRDAETLLDDVIPLLEDKAEPVRMQAAFAIGALPGDRRRAVEPLSAALFDHDCYVRTAAALALQAIGPAARQAGPALTEAVRDTRNLVPNSFARQSRMARPGLLLCGDDLEDLSVAIAARRALEAITTQPPDKGVAAQ